MGVKWKVQICKDLTDGEGTGVYWGYSAPMMVTSRRCPRSGQMGGRLGLRGFDRLITVRPPFSHQRELEGVRGVHRELFYGIVLGGVDIGLAWA